MTAHPPSPPRRAARQDPDQRQQLILAAACRCLGARGMRGFTLRNIASEAQVSVSLLSHYFGSMEALAAAVFRTILQEAEPAPCAAPRNIAEASANLAAVIAGSLDPAHQARRNLLAWLPIYEEMLLNPRMRRALERIDRAAASEISRRIADVARLRDLAIDADALAHDLMALLDGLWMRCCLSGRKGRDREIKAALRFLEAALGPLGSL